MNEMIINFSDEIIEYIVSQEVIYDGLRVRLAFPNGYGASVINHKYSYGLELTVLYDGKLCYDTPITGGEISDLTTETLNEVLIELSQL